MAIRSMLFKFVLLEICLISYFLVFQTPLLRLEKKQIEVSHFGIFVTLCNVFFYICIEKIAPKLPEIYTEPYRVKHFNKDIFIRNSTIISAVNLEKKQIEVSRFGIFVTLCNVFVRFRTIVLSCPCVCPSVR
jgi:hypothetical protein